MSAAHIDLRIFTQINMVVLSLTTQTRKISKKMSKQKSRKALCSKDFLDFLFIEKLREKCENLSLKRSNSESGEKRKASKA